MGKLRHREMKLLAKVTQGAGWQGRDLNPYHVFNTLMFFFFMLSLRDRERQSMSGGRAERERD